MQLSQLQQLQQTHRKKNILLNAAVVPTLAASRLPGKSQPVTSFLQLYTLNSILWDIVDEFFEQFGHSVPGGVTPKQRLAAKATLGLVGTAQWWFWDNAFSVAREAFGRAPAGSITTLVQKQQRQLTFVASLGILVALMAVFMVRDSGPTLDRAKQAVKEIRRMSKNLIDAIAQMTGDSPQRIGILVKGLLPWIERLVGRQSTRSSSDHNPQATQASRSHHKNS